MEGIWSFPFLPVIARKRRDTMLYQVTLPPFFPLAGGEEEKRRAEEKGEKSSRLFPSFFPPLRLKCLSTGLLPPSFQTVSGFSVRRLDKVFLLPQRATSRRRDTYEAIKASPRSSASRVRPWIFDLHPFPLPFAPPSPRRLVRAVFPLFCLRRRNRFTHRRRLRRLRALPPPLFREIAALWPPPTSRNAPPLSDGRGISSLGRLPKMIHAVFPFFFFSRRMEEVRSKVF